MVCVSPRTMYWTGGYTANGKREYTFTPSRGYLDMSVKVPCGQCVGCINDKRREMSLRMNDEAQLYERNCFLTLTVDDEHINEVFPDCSLSKRPFQLFMKRLREQYHGDFVERPRWYVGKNWNYYPIRCVYCGEYGSLSKRPHYHAILFNFDFSDKLLLKDDGVNRLYTSPALSTLWPFGLSSIGAVSFGSCAYVAGYVLKKTKNDEDYVNLDTGVIREKEFVVYPRGFGLGRNWLEKYKEDVYAYDRRVLRGGQFLRPPKYYDKILSCVDAERMDRIKLSRLKAQREAPPQNLTAKAEILAASQKFAKEKRK